MDTLQADQVLTDQMVEKAAEICAERLFNGDTSQVYQNLKQGRCDICGAFSHQIIHQVGMYLGGIDPTVKAVYQIIPDAVEGKPYLEKPIPPGALNLVVWVVKKNPALLALGESLEKALTESRCRVGCSRALPACYSMNLQTVDDRDVLEGRGFGLVVASRRMNNLQVWSREVPTHPSSGDDLPLNLDIIPEDRLLSMAREIEQLPEPERSNQLHQLHEIKVTLIRKLISDHLAYINLAREWLTIDDLVMIHSRKFGTGRIGGKAAGMLLAARILGETAEDTIRERLRIPESYFMGSDLMYTFMAMNGLIHWHNQKYKSEDRIRREFPLLEIEFGEGQFPPETLSELRGILDRIGQRPLIVRSSSQLEDNFGASFAGKYMSQFCPNQGTLEQNLTALTQAISRTYASTFRPEALLYRRDRRLLDYDERMAILIQVVDGERWGRYYLPFGAGVAFSQNIYRWSPEIRKDDGFSRLVWGLGTRAVERVGNDYPRMVALSHPAIQPDDASDAIRRYSQRFVDVIDLEENSLRTLPIHDVLKNDYPPIRWMTQMEQDGYFITPRSRVMESELPRLTITYDELLRRTDFPSMLTRILKILAEKYHTPVDIEYTLQMPNPDDPRPEIIFTLLQCRPQSSLKSGRLIPFPTKLSAEDVLFSSDFMTPRGHLGDIKTIIYVDPNAYFGISDEATRNEIGRAVSQLNSVLPKKSFISIGPGRWGSTNLDLGVYVAYADICNAGALIELSGHGAGLVSEASLGTHFFQDLMEAQIYPIVIDLDRPGTQFNQEFFSSSLNCLKDHINGGETLMNCLRVIDVATARPNHHLEIIMDDEKGQSLAYFKEDES